MSQNSSKLKVVVVVGPTSSGKSALAVKLARRFGGEVISADSRQVYRGLNLGSGKITRTEMNGVPHHLLDVANPRQQFSAGDFVFHATAALQKITTKDKLPIICGGTGFYIDALLGDTSLPEVPPNKKLRLQLQQKTNPQLLAILHKLSPRRVREIDPHNHVRLIRAIEIARALGDVPPIKKSSEKYSILKIGLQPPEKVLYRKIEARLSVRLHKGMIAEARRLHEKGLSWKRMEELGLEYRYLARFLQKKISRAEFEEQLLREIIHYTKRQWRWWKRDSEIHWFQTGADKKIPALINSFLK